MSKENPELVSLIRELKIQAIKKKVRIWKDIAERLEKPNRNYPKVNVSKFEKYANDDDFIIVPGKVLGTGTLNKKVKVAAWKFSQKAKEKIEKAGGKAITIQKAMKENPKGTNMRIMG